MTIVFALAIIFVAITLFLLLQFLPKQARSLQRQNIRAAQKTLRSLRDRNLTAEEQLPVVIGTLRKLDPFQFEELILTCLQERGYRIVRNKRYTGDGGIDGRVYLNGQQYLIQAKRYRHHINAQHVSDFEMVIAQEGAAGGYFVHTGKTGKLSRQIGRRGTITFISGQALVHLVLNKPGDFLSPL
ncbi:MAG: restriction endonuclease [Bacteroidota bacterium]